MSRRVNLCQASEVVVGPSGVTITPEPLTKRAENNKARQAKAAPEAEAKRKSEEAEQQRAAAAKAEEERQAKAAAEAEAKRTGVS